MHASPRSCRDAPGRPRVLFLADKVDDGGRQPVARGTGFSHIAVQTDDLAATLADLAEKGVSFEEPQRPASADEPRTSVLLDPDGYRLELVQWPPGHPDDMTRADFL